MGAPRRTNLCQALEPRMSMSGNVELMSSPMLPDHTRCARSTTLFASGLSGSQHHPFIIFHAATATMIAMMATVLLAGGSANPRSISVRARMEQRHQASRLRRTASSRRRLRNIPSAPLSVEAVLEAGTSIVSFALISILAPRKTAFAVRVTRSRLRLR
jgi:hypothetical protein